jgi:hypothetical protein
MNARRRARRRAPDFANVQTASRKRIGDGDKSQLVFRNQQLVRPPPILAGRGQTAKTPHVADHFLHFRTESVVLRVDSGHTPPRPHRLLTVGSPARRDSQLAYRQC